MMHDGDVGAKVSLRDLLPDSTLVAVGALSELRGEVTVVRGRAYLAYPDVAERSRTQIEATPEESATLLVTARVATWSDVEVETEVSFAELDSTLEEWARRAGVSTRSPFPFLIEGAVRRPAWHVIDGSRLEGGGGSHEQHREAAIVHTAPESEMLLVGFFSNAHQGVFTHRDSRTHVHAIDLPSGSSGHLDAGTILPGARVRFPGSRRSENGSR
jgi:acetolactate decarboxylase